MQSFLIFMGIVYTIAIAVQIMACAASMRKAKAEAGNATFDHNLMTPQNI